MRKKRASVQVEHGSCLGADFCTPCFAEKPVCHQVYKVTHSRILLSINSNGCASSIPTLSVEAYRHEMADNKENMGAVTHQLSGVDDDMRKGGDVQEKTVASVALGAQSACICLQSRLTYYSCCS